MLQKAKDLGIEIESWIIDDGVSGTKEPEDRKLGKLLKKIKKGDTIISSELSRLGRSLFMVMRILEHCMKMECKVYTVKDGYELGDNIQSKVLAFAFALAAEIERDMISKRTKEALARKKAEGVILGRPRGVKTNPDVLKLKPFESKIKNFLKLGLSVSAIAKLLKVNRITVSKFMKENDLEKSIFKNSPKNRKNEISVSMQAMEILIDKNELIEEFKKHFSTVKLAERYDTTPVRINAFIKKHCLDEILQIEKKQRIKMPSKGFLERESVVSQNLL